MKSLFLAMLSGSLLAAPLEPRGLHQEIKTKPHSRWVDTCFTPIGAKASHRKITLSTPTKTLTLQQGESLHLCLGQRIKPSELLLDLGTADFSWASLKAGHPTGWKSVTLSPNASTLRIKSSELPAEIESLHLKNISGKAVTVRIKDFSLSY